MKVGRGAECYFGEDSMRSFESGESGATESGISWMTKVQGAASELFQIAALLLGDETGAALLVEEAVAGMDADPCEDEQAARVEARARLIQAALGRLEALRPGALAAPLRLNTAAMDCLDSEGMQAARRVDADADEIFAGTGNANLKQWLQQLSPVRRAVFVLRAMVGEDSAAAAETLRHSLGGGAPAWTVEAVKEVFRQALCSLSASWVHAVSAPVEA